MLHPVVFGSAFLVSHFLVRGSPEQWRKVAFAVASVALIFFTSSWPLSLGLFALNLSNFYFSPKNPPKPPTSPPVPPPESIAPTDTLSPAPIQRDRCYVPILAITAPSGENPSLEQILDRVLEQTKEIDLNLRWHGRSSLQRVFFQLLISDEPFRRLWSGENSQKRAIMTYLAHSERLFAGMLSVKDLFRFGLQDSTPEYLASSPLYYHFGTYGRKNFLWEATGSSRVKTIHVKTDSTEIANESADRLSILREMYELGFRDSEKTLLRAIQTLTPIQLVQSLLAILPANISSLVGSSSHNDLKALGEQGYHWLSDLRRLLETPIEEGKAQQADALWSGPEVAHAFDTAHLSAMLYRVYISQELDEEHRALTNKLSTQPLGFIATSAPTTVTHFDVGRQYFRDLIEKFQRGQLPEQTSETLRIRLENTLYRLCCLDKQLPPTIASSELPKWNPESLLPIPETVVQFWEPRHETWDPKLHSALIWQGYCQIPSNAVIPEGYEWTLKPGQMIKNYRQYYVCWPIYAEDTDGGNLKTLEQFFYYYWQSFNYSLFEESRSKPLPSSSSQYGWGPAQKWYVPKQISIPMPPGFPLKLCLEAALRVYLRIIQLPLPSHYDKDQIFLEEICLDWKNYFPNVVEFEGITASDQELAAAWKSVCDSEANLDLSTLPPLDSLKEHRPDIHQKHSYPTSLSITDGTAKPETCLAQWISVGAHELPVAPASPLLLFSSPDQILQTLQRLHTELKRWLGTSNTRTIEAFVGHNGKPYTVKKAGTSVIIQCPVTSEDLRDWELISPPSASEPILSLNITPEGTWTYSLHKDIQPNPTPAENPRLFPPEVLLTGYCLSVFQQIDAYCHLGMLSSTSHSEAKEMENLWTGAKLLETRFSQVCSKGSIQLINPVLCSKDSAYTIRGQQLSPEECQSFGMKHGIRLESEKNTVGRGFGRGSENRQISLLVGQTAEGLPCVEFVIGHTSADGGFGMHFAEHKVKRIRAIKEEGNPLTFFIQEEKKSEYSDSMFGTSGACAPKPKFTHATSSEIKEDLQYLKQALGSIFAMLESPYTIIDGARTYDGQLHSDEMLMKLSLGIQGHAQNRAAFGLTWLNRSPYACLAENARKQLQDKPISLPMQPARLLQ